MKSRKGSAPVVIFWLLVGVVLSAIFAPGLLAVVGMWLLLLALPIIGIMIGDLFGAGKKSTPRESLPKSSSAKEPTSSVSVLVRKEPIQTQPTGMKSICEPKSTEKASYAQYNEGDLEIRGLEKHSISQTMLAHVGECVLVREPTNAYDRNAILVVDVGNRKIGYVAKEKAAELAPLMDAGKNYNVCIIPHSYQDVRWGTCRARLVERVSTQAAVVHDPRLKRERGVWTLLLEGRELESVMKTQGNCFIFSCSELLARDLALEWTGEDMKIGMRLSSEHFNRYTDVIQESGRPQRMIELCFAKVVVQQVEPFDVGNEKVHAMIRGLEYIKVDGKIVPTVRISRLKDNNIYHMTAVANLKTILASGILSKHRVVDQGLLKGDISDVEIQGHRETKFVNGRSLHDFASFYFNPHNAMLYRVSNRENRDVVVLAVSSGCFEGTDYVVSDRNAATRVARFGSSQVFIDGLAWDTIFAESWNLEDKIAGENIKQIMQSELLVPDAVSPGYIERIYCKNSETASRVRSICAQMGHNASVCVDSDLFFVKHTYGGYRGYRYHNR